MSIRYDSTKKKSLKARNSLTVTAYLPTEVTILTVLVYVAVLFTLYNRQRARYPQILPRMLFSVLYGRSAKVRVTVSHEPHLISLSLSPRMICSNKVITLINSCAWWTVIR